MTTSELVATEAGEARITYHRAAAPKAVLALGHGAGGGIGARDLVALAEGLPPRGITVALVEQPWKVAGKKMGPSAARTLDLGWRPVAEHLAGQGLPLVVGGRSAGARVACRTGAATGAVGVVALAFPLHPPGRPEKSRAEELLESGLPTLVVQSAADPFGGPGEFPALPEGHELVAVPYGSHGFEVPRRAPVGQDEVLGLIRSAVGDWVLRLV
ncbi:alpha/beta family hydrolase [Streptomyces sp. FH025]|uniref:alpha/beta hydrolase family protein n=1 Tax=Streptomyces sp. FH025 TaxID=2815937 RepID=UPI001A9CCA6D|nr:alpha/beta family hydrolase [Streptomyces sp. FH025]MBO1418199.1 hydrolase [Streptomyces sp. FH025]